MPHWMPLDREPIMPSLPEPLTTYLPRLAELSPVMRFTRMDDATLTPWAFQSAAIYKRLCELDAGVSFWRGGTDGGFDMPADAVRTWQITIDHAAETLDVLLTPTHAYVMAFASTKPGADGHPHPKRAFRLKRAYWDSFIRAARAHLGMGKYPARQPDTSFKRDGLPYGALLRCVPDDVNNVPVLTCIPVPLEVYMTPPLYPPDNPVWRQVIRNSSSPHYWWRKP